MWWACLSLACLSGEKTKVQMVFLRFRALVRDARGRRYTHSREYLEAVCRDSGFRVLVCSEMVLRKNAGAPVRGFIFVTEAALL